MVVIAIVIILVLGWIIFEQSSAKKNQEEHNNRFKNYDLKRKENFKKVPEFLDNYSKTESIFRKLVDSEINGLEVLRTFEPDDQTTQITRNVSLTYNDIEFYITLTGTYFDCRCLFLSKKNKNLNFDIKFANNEDDNITISNITNELKRLSKYEKEKMLN
ncbi:hypothetical protein AX016_0423 [Cellulophaga sp. RHA19]|uniref:hypothetical protein n=1 Tax=Cellulophaga sp. RHA19 TaxID=1798237 RepID=UPI000C2CA309|nr:hypothetical protein [Cellulophaga sp. RHA19]PKB42259.1 hypothetical protein AX016_0423 [Cellulophaga sp. RHA19]